MLESLSKLVARGSGGTVEPQYCVDPGCPMGRHKCYDPYHGIYLCCQGFPSC